ncbi:hypothetical protein F4781DRAFT_408532, partial [Annulohypoxylon bovei var. microspora]
MWLTNRNVCFIATFIHSCLLNLFAIVNRDIEFLRFRLMRMMRYSPGFYHYFYVTNLQALPFNQTSYSLNHCIANSRSELFWMIPRKVP